MVLQCCALNCSERHVSGQKRTVSFHSFPKDQLRRNLWAQMLKRANFVPTNHTRICSKHFTEDCFDRQKLGGVWLRSSAVPTMFDFDGSPQTSHNGPKFTKKKKAVNETRCSDATDGPASDGMTISSFAAEVPEIIVESRTFPEQDFEAFASQALSALEVAAEDTSEDISEASEGSLHVKTPEKSRGTKRSPTSPTSWSTPKRRPTEKSPVRSLRYLGDYTPCTVRSPSKAGAFMSLVKTTIASKNALLKRIDMKNRRLTKRVASLKAIAFKQQAHEKRPSLRPR